MSTAGAGCLGRRPGQESEHKGRRGHGVPCHMCLGGRAAPQDNSFLLLFLFLLHSLLLSFPLFSCFPLKNKTYRLL